MTKQQHDGATILRVAGELRGWLSDAPVDDAEAQSLLRDCAVLERNGRWLMSGNVIVSGGIPCAEPRFESGFSRRKAESTEGKDKDGEA